MKKSFSYGISSSLSLLLLMLVGCGPSSPEVHAFKGKLELYQGDIRQLAGSKVEISLINNPNVRGFAPILEDGSFEMSSLKDGTVLTGVPAGDYFVRLILNDDDSATWKKANQIVGSNYQKFSSSNWKISVPGEGTAVLKILPR